MPKKGILVNTARKEVINEPELIALLKEREDLRYFADIRPGAHEEFELLLATVTSRPPRRWVLRRLKPTPTLVWPLLVRSSASSRKATNASV